jgi:RNA polymerase sigma-70 factor (ECF subfamily)
MDKKEETYKRLIAENKFKIFSICRYYAPTNEDQKDMFQEILVNIWKSFESFRGESEIGTWLYRIAINTSLNYAGKHYKKMKLNVKMEDVNLTNYIAEDEGSSKLTEEKFNELQVQLNQLSVIDKALMGLILEGLSTKEIADIIGLTEPNVRVKIHRIKESLQIKIKGGRNGK